MASMISFRWLFSILCLVSCLYSADFTTYIGLTEENGIVKATLFVIKESTETTYDLKYFDDALKKAITGKSIMLTEKEIEQGTSLKQTIETVKGADLYFYYYDGKGEKKEVPGCAPVQTSLIQDMGPETGVFYYAICTVPYPFYKKTSINIYIEYGGGDGLGASQREIVIYDLSAGGMNVVADIVQREVDPTNPTCLGGLILLGLLLASLYFSGKSPLTYLDISVPRTPKPKVFSYGSLVAGMGNIRIMSPAKKDEKYLDKIIALYSKFEFRNLDLKVKKEIEKRKMGKINKYLAKKIALAGGNWEDIEKTDDKVLLNNAKNGVYGKMDPYLLQVMSQSILINKVIKSVKVVIGNYPQWLADTLTFFREKRPVKYLLGETGLFVTVGVGSAAYSGRALKLGLKAASSPIVRKALGKRYSTIDEKLKGKDKDKVGRIDKFFYNIAAMTDPKKIVTGELFPIFEYAERAYEDLKASLYDEVVKNILWGEIYTQLKKNKQLNLKEILEKQLDLKTILTDPRFIECLESVKIPEKYKAILQNSDIGFKEKAEKMLLLANKTLPTRADAQILFDKIQEADRGASSVFVKCNELVKFIRNTYKIDQPHDLSDSIINGKFFVTTARNTMYYEENGKIKNFVLFALGLKEYMDQMVFLGYTGKRKEFTIADGFKLALAKLSSQVLGHGAWYETTDAENYMEVFDNTTKKTVKKAFVKEILGLDEEATKNIRARMQSYLEGFMSEEGKAKMRADGTKVEDFLYGYDILSTKKKEETDRNPFKRRNWYFMRTETYPEQKYWNANMNFFWASIPGYAGKEVTVLHEVMMEKIVAYVPRKEPPWTLIAKYMDTRAAKMINGSEWDFYGQEQKEHPQLQRFARSNTQKFFNENWEFISKTKDALSKYAKLKLGHEVTDDGLIEFLSKDENKKITYDTLRKTGIPFIHTHDFGYIPYFEGGPLATGNDRVLNGTCALKDENGRWKPLKPKEYLKYVNELKRAAPELQSILEGIRRNPDHIHSKNELDNIKNILFEKHGHLSSELKYIFIYQFSNMTHNYGALLNDERAAKFYTILPDRDVPARNWFEHLYRNDLWRNIAAGFETWAYATGKIEAEAMASNVAVSELYRERGHDMRMRIKGGLLDDYWSSFNEEDRAALKKAYDDYANSYQRFFLGWVYSVTRDPRGSSTQWGRDWYLRTLYHRGFAVPPEPQAIEKYYLDPFDWFTHQHIYRGMSLNWMYGGPLVRMVRAFQTALYHYPTPFDKNITSSGEADAREPWPYSPSMKTSTLLRYFLNPFESAIAINKLNLPKMILGNTLQVIPGVNTLVSHFFPKLDVTADSRYQVEWDKYNPKFPKWLAWPFHEQPQVQYGRGGQNIQDGIKQTAEAFFHFGGGAALHHFTDSANPGISYLDYTGRGQLDPRIARFLVGSITGEDKEDTDAWRVFFKQDEYVKRQSSYSMGRRLIAPEFKQASFQEEFHGYGPVENPMWALLTPLFAIYHGGKALKTLPGILKEPFSGIVTGLGAAAVAGPIGGLATFALHEGILAYKNELNKRAQHAARVQLAINRGEAPPPPRAVLKEYGDKFVENLSFTFSNNMHACPFCNNALVLRGKPCSGCGSCLGY